jgi:hypothetical protein
MQILQPFGPAGTLTDEAKICLSGQDLIATREATNVTVISLSPRYRMSGPYSPVVVVVGIGAFERKRKV